MTRSKNQKRQVALRQLMAKMNKQQNETAKAIRAKRIVQRPKRKRNNNRNRMEREGYFTCRLMPFRSVAGSTGIPDGTNTRRLVVDHRITHTLTFGSSGVLNILMMPALPSCAWVYFVDKDTKVDGVALTSSEQSGRCYAMSIPEWSAMNVSYRATAGDYDQVGVLYGADKFRIVTMGWNVTYIGTTLNDSGYVKASTMNISFGTRVPNTSTFNVGTWDGATHTGYGPDEVFVRTCNTYVSQALFTGGNANTTIVSPLRKGMNGVLRHTGQDYDYRELAAYATFPGQVEDTNESLLLNGGFKPTKLTDTGVLLGYDEGWDATALYISGGTTGQSILLDIIYCVEYSPSPISGVYALATTGSDPKPRLMESVARIAKSEPIAKVGSAIETVSKVATAVATMV